LGFLSFEFLLFSAAHKKRREAALVPGSGNDGVGPKLFAIQGDRLMAPITKMRIHRFGGNEALQADDVEPSLPDAGQILVAVRAASVSPVDFKIRSGKYPAVKDDRLPYTLGRDFSGIVEKCGAQATRWLEPEDRRDLLTDMWLEVGEGRLLPADIPRRVREFLSDHRKKYTNTGRYARDSLDAPVSFDNPTSRIERLTDADRLWSP
jgi:hypothetical protein